MPVPDPAWFHRRPPSLVHGPGHVARVMAWAAVLARETALPEDAEQPLLWAAACHDLMREDDGPDPEHGLRAADWVRANLPRILGGAPGWLETAALACRWHVTPDERIPWTHVVLWTLKDADALDRVRLGDLEPRFLRGDPARALVPRARELFVRTRDERDPARVWQAADGLGLAVRARLESLSRAPVARTENP